LSDRQKFSPEEWMLLGLAGAFNTEKARWNTSKGPEGFMVTRETDEAYPRDVEVRAHCKNLGEALEKKAIMEDMAAAMAFMMAMNRIGDNWDKS
jgi:hypothetical protein